MCEGVLVGLLVLLVIIPIAITAIGATWLLGRVLRLWRKGVRG